MLVVGYAFQIPEFQAKVWKGVEAVELELGRQYVFKGKFRQFSDTGFSNAAGLLEFMAVQRVDPKSGATRWVFPPGAPWHPLELARIEEENARLRAKAGKARQ
jgi:hypothetical protein